jgi:hypothetical protein
MKRNCGEREQLADDFVDDHRTGIALIEDLFRSPAADNTDQEKNGNNTEKGQQVHAADQQPEEHANRRPPSTWGFGKIAAVRPGGDEHQDTVHDSAQERGVERRLIAA